MRLLDCTLRDGGNVLGNGFPKDLTVMILEGLLDNNITLIEFGNAYGIGAYEADGKTAPCTDIEYLDLASPYLARGDLGMFIGIKNTSERNIALAASKGMKFLRIGANAGDAGKAKDAIDLIRKNGMLPLYSLMKGYVLAPKDLAREAEQLQDWGLAGITIMDSAGTMTPDSVKDYVEEMRKLVSIPIGFHGHNNLGLSAANALAAEQSGVETLDSGLLGMARSAGNLATELAVGLFKREGKLDEVDFFGLLDFINSTLAPAMDAHGYKAAVCPDDLILGYAGCHSNFMDTFKKIAMEEKVKLYELIIVVSAKNRKNPSAEEIREAAKRLKEN